MPRYDFECTAGHVSEYDVSRLTFTARCPCGGEARRRLAVMQLITARAVVPKNQRVVHIGEYQEAAQETDYRWSKLEYEMDRPLERPDYFGVANGKAQDALAGKIAPPKGWTDPLKAT